METYGVDGLEIDLGQFDLSAPKGRVETRYCKPKLYRQVAQRSVKYDKAKDLIDDLLPSIVAGERIDAIVSGNFIFGDMIEALAVQANCEFDDVTICTLSINQENVDSLHNLLAADRIKNLNLIVSDFFWSHYRSSRPYIYEKLDIDNRFQLAVAGVHAKITLIEVEGRKIVISGSANFRSSRSVETFTIETNPDLYDFHAAWMRDIVRDYATIKKSIRGEKLFDIIGKSNVS